MTKKDKAPKKNSEKITKNDLPVLDSDQDLFSAFMNAPSSMGSGENGPEDKNKRVRKDRTTPKLNKHGLPVIEEFEEQFLSRDQDLLSEVVPNESGGSAVPKEPVEQEALEENFAQLLEASLKEKTGPVKKRSNPVPIKKRLKRYPPPRRNWTFMDLQHWVLNSRPRPLFQPVSTRGIFPCGSSLARDCILIQGRCCPT